MAVRRPQPDDLNAIARQFHFTIPPERMAVVQALLEGLLAPYDRLDELEAPAAAPRYPRGGGAAPRPEENPLGAWAWRVRIDGAGGGPLAGRTVAVKDNVAVAGVPMRNGTVVLDGYVPDEDATVVTRILDAGGTVLGKAVCESLCFSGGSHTADCDPVRNPHDPTRSTGGSSSGSAALVAAGEVDMAIGGDQVEEVSIPWHRDAMPVQRLSETVKLAVLAGSWMAEAHHGRYYAKAQNLARRARAAYDAVLSEHDLLVMPTLPLKATPIPPPGAPLEEYVRRALEMIPNTAPFDVTGHPAMSVPCAMSAGLPVGMMLVGRPGDEATILRAADAFEREVFSPPLPVRS